MLKSNKATLLGAIVFVGLALVVVACARAQATKPHFDWPTDAATVQPFDAAFDAAIDAKPQASETPAAKSVVDVGASEP